MNRTRLAAPHPRRSPAPPRDPLLPHAEQHLRRVTTVLAHPHVRATRHRDALYLAAQGISAGLMTLPALPHDQTRHVILIAWLCTLTTGLAALRHHTVTTGTDADCSESETINESNRFAQYDLHLLVTLKRQALRRATHAANTRLPGVNPGSTLAAPVLSALLLPPLNVPLTLAAVALASAAWFLQARLLDRAYLARAEAQLARTAWELKRDENEHAEQYERYRKTQTDHLLDQIVLDLDHAERRRAQDSGT